MAESPSDKTNRRNRSRGRRPPPTIDLKATPVAEPDPAMQAAAAAMADEPGSTAAPRDSGLPGEAVLGTGRSRAAPPDHSPESPSIDAAEVLARDGRPDAAGRSMSASTLTEPLTSTVTEPANASVREPSIVTSAAHVDEKLIETAERRGGASTLEGAEPRSGEAPVSAIRLERSAGVEAAGSAPDGERGKKGFGLPTLLAATTLSGLLGAGLMLLAAPYVRGPMDRMAARLDQVERRVGALPSTDLTAIERRLAAIDPEQRALADRVTRLQAQTEAALAKAEAVERTVAQSPSAAATSPGAPAVSTDAAPPLSNERTAEVIEPLSARLTTLEGALRALARTGAEASAAALAEQGQRVAALEARLKESLASSVGVVQQLAQQTGALAQQGESLTDQAQRLKQIDQTLGSQTQSVAQLNETLVGQAKKSAQSDQMLSDQTKQVATQGERVAGLEKQLAAQRPEAMNAALRVVATDRVVDALRDGSPFPQALAALRRLSPEPAALAPLEPLATSGAPTAAALAEEFKPLGQRIVTEARGPTNDVSGRLWRMAEGVVAVRPLTEAGSTSTPGLVARIEGALDRGALQEAAAAWDALPEPSRQASDVWGRKLKTRIAADDATKKLSAAALASLEAAAR